MLAQSIHVMLLGEKSEVITAPPTYKNVDSASLFILLVSLEGQSSAVPLLVLCSVYSLQNEEDILWYLFNERHQANGRLPKLQQKGTLTHVIIVVTGVKGNS